MRVSADPSTVDAALSDVERREVGRKARAAVLASLQALGGEGQRRELLDRALSDGGFTDRELAEPAPRGDHVTFVEYRLSWALSNLKRDGLIENPRWSVWCLSGVATQATVAASTEPLTASRLAELRAMPHREYLRTPEWRRVRAAALDRAGHRCSLDRSHTEDLEVHHNTYERIGAELASDLVVLCRACHRLHHQSNGRPQRPRVGAEAEAARAAGSIAPPTLLASDSNMAAVPPTGQSAFRRLLGRT